MTLPSPPWSWSSLDFFRTEWAQVSARLLQEKLPWVPQPQQIFTALDLVCPSSVRVVILGQDPYPNRQHATGLAFSAPAQSAPKPGSLKIIFDELEDDLGIKRMSCDLTGWARQGVLLINASLTTTEGVPKAHNSLGWKMLTKEVISKVDARHPVVFVFWGRDAIKFERYVKNQSAHEIIKSSHPSKQGMWQPCKGNPPFRGSRPFSRINHWLSKRSLPTIDWSK